MNKCTAIFFLLLLTVARITLAQEQQAGPIASKTISKSIVLSPGDVFIITGEKASITLSGWDKDHISVKITFSAGHTDKIIATKELEYMHYALSRDKNAVELRNAFILPSKTDRLQ